MPSPISINILCVDDDFNSRELIRFMFSRKNEIYNVTTAAVTEAENLINLNQ
jgi:CheY-like chemotaxis protein